MGETIHVLLVDDQERFVQNTARLLTARSFHVSTASSGEAAIQKINAREDIDVIVLDVKMPGMGGIEALRAIKRIRADIEVIMLTGHAALDSGIEAIRLGAFDYLMKPCEIEDLAGKIRTAFDMEQIRQRPVLWTRNTLQEVLRPDFLQLPPEADCCRAVEIWSAAPEAPAADSIFILDRNQALIGSLSRSGLQNAVAHLFPENVADWSDLADHRSRLAGVPITLALQAESLLAHPGEAITEAAHRMIHHQTSRVAVIDDGRMIGVACMRDLLAHIEQEIE